MAHWTYKKLHKQLTELIEQGKIISVRDSGTKGSDILEWIRKSRSSLLLLEDTIRTALKAFDRLQFSFKVDEDDEPNSSDSAYRPDHSDVLLDFNFEKLQQAVRLLELAQQKLELDSSLRSSAPGRVRNRHAGDRNLRGPDALPTNPTEAAGDDALPPSAPRADTPALRGTAPSAPSVPDLNGLIAGKDRVNISTAARYLQRSQDHVRRLVRQEKLDRLGEVKPITVSTASLRKYKGKRQTIPSVPAMSLVMK